jgi:hypothetical protein
VTDASVVAFDTKSRKRVAAARPPRRYPARIARELALAHALQRRLDAGVFADYADMARAPGFTRARSRSASARSARPAPVARLGRAAAGVGAADEGRPAASVTAEGTVPTFGAPSPR